MPNCELAQHLSAKFSATVESALEVTLATKLSAEVEFKLDE
jgi:hypothetical protein